MSIRVEGLIINFTAGAAVAPFRVVKFGSGDKLAVQSSAATDAHIGVSDSLGATAQGDPLDVIRSGIAQIEYGGSITRGQPLTADSNGKAVAASAGAGTRIIGFAEVSGVSGDIGSVFLAPGFAQTSAGGG